MEKALILYGLFGGAAHALLFVVGGSFEMTVVFELFSLVCVTAGAALAAAKTRPPMVRGTKDLAGVQPAAREAEEGGAGRGA